MVLNEKPVDHRLRTMNVAIHCWDISVWTEVADRLTDMAIPRDMLLANS